MSFHRHILRSEFSRVLHSTEKKDQLYKRMKRGRWNEIIMKGVLIDRNGTIDSLGLNRWSIRFSFLIGEHEAIMVRRSVTFRCRLITRYRIIKPKPESQPIKAQTEISTPSQRKISRPTKSLTRFVWRVLKNEPDWPNKKSYVASCMLCLFCF